MAGCARLVAERLTLPLPLHVLIPTNGSRPRDRALRCHVIASASPLSRATEIAPGLLACPPEAALCQMASTSDFATLALAAYEACGSYAIAPEAEDGFLSDLQPIVDVATIRAVLQSSGMSHSGRGFKGLASALRATLDGAASPAEASLSLIACAGRRMGGYGLPTPILNAKLPVTGNAMGLTRKTAIRPDLLWSSHRLALEYLGSRHAKRRRMEQDAGRENALAHMGYDVIRVTAAQVRDPRLLDGIMAELAERLGVVQTIPSRRMLERRAALHGRLYGTKRYD